MTAAGRGTDRAYVSEDVAREIRRRFDLQLADVPSGLQDFVERHDASHANAQGGYMGFEKPCPDQDRNLRPPKANETCDYVTTIKRCDGDLSERAFKQPRHPAYLASEYGPEHPRRLVCHED